MRKVLPILACGSMLSACATTSFAPPPVEMDYVLDKRTVPLNRCIDETRASGTTDPRIKPNFKGAQQMIDNFMVGYRCAERSAANGRAHFEVPAFLLGATAALGQSFGLSSDATLGIGAGAVGAGQSSSYFAPQAKADYLNSAINALTCIQMESVGVPGFDLTEEPKGADNGDAKAMMFALDGDAVDTTVSVGAHEQYFRMIMGALLSVERVLARRLNHAGTPYDAAGITAQIELLSQKEEEGPPADPTGSAKTLMDLQGKVGLSADEENRLKSAKETYATLKVKELQPKLQKCVILAKV